MDRPAAEFQKTKNQPVRSCCRETTDQWRFEICGLSGCNCKRTLNVIELIMLSEIYNFRAVGDRLGTAGQPTEQQFQAIRDAGYEVVLNIALPTSDNALPNEGSLVTGLGM